MLIFLFINFSIFKKLKTRFRHVTEIKPKFIIKNFLDAKYELKCINDFVTKYHDEKKKKYKDEVNQFWKTTIPKKKKKIKKINKQKIKINN